MSPAAGAAPECLPALNVCLSAQEIAEETEAAIAACRAQFDAIAAVPADARSYATVMRPWAAAEGAFMTRTASVTFPQYVAVEEAVRAAATAASKRVDEFHIERSMREDLYRAARGVADATDGTALDAEEQRFLDKVLLEFRHNGLELPEGPARARLRALRQQLADACTDFARALNEDTTALSLSAEDLAGAPADFLAGLPRDADGRFRVSMKYPDLFGVLRHVRSEHVRRAMDEANGRRCAGNRALLADAVRMRHEAAALLGYPTHAALVLEDKMARTPGAARAFLDALRTRLVPFAQAELARLGALKEAETGTPVLGSWDYHYYTRQLLEREWAVDAEHVRQFFALEPVTDAMLALFADVLGLAFARVPDAPVWHADVALWAVRDRHRGNALLGHVYLDLFPRAGKYTHAACFNLVPGYDTGAGRQLPVAAMVANFTRPTPDAPSLLTHDEVVTLFHELGHAMHDMCARVRVPRFHGTAVEGDFVEAPSQMLENWCWQEATLTRLSAHHRTGAPLPPDLAARLVRTKNVNAGLLNLRQVFFATWDLTIHGPAAPDLSPDAIDALYAQLRAEISLVPQPAGVWPAASFGHMMGGYDAGYYGYLWSQVFSADMFYSRFLPVLDAPGTVGDQYRREILQPGGSRDGMVSLKAFLGREPVQEPFLRSLGLTP